LSKAFTKETDTGLDADEADEGEPEDAAALPGVPAGAKNYMTPSGAASLRGELHTLLHEARPEMVRTVSWAASNGDRSENGDYIYGKRRLREIDRRIRFLTRRLDRAEVIDPVSQSSERVLFGATVEVRDEDGKMNTYRIVGIDETDVRNGKISWISPIGKALLQSRVGDVVSLRTPKGEQELEVLGVRYEEI